MTSGRKTRKTTTVFAQAQRMLHKVYGPKVKLYKSNKSEKKYMVYNKKLRPVTVDMLINDINNLDKNNQTIGNYFLIKNSSYLHNLLLN